MSNLTFMPCNIPHLTKISVYYLILNDGCGSAGMRYFLTREEAEKWADDHEGDECMMADDTIDMIETYEGSNIHLRALKYKEND